MQKSIKGADVSPAAGSDTGSGEAVPGARPARERRSRNRVGDDQKSGQGALTALSRLQMIERRRAALSPDAGE
jgi:hypothetical protein